MEYFQAISNFEPKSKGLTQVACSLQPSLDVDKMWHIACVASSFPGFQIGLASLIACIAFAAARLLSIIARLLGKRRLSPPCERVIEQAERTNRQNGHENAGFLSRRAAFSPLKAPRTSLPRSYAQWDNISASLPSLIQAGMLRATLDSMPVLNAYSEKELPGQYLQRAATILGLLAHAYVRLEGNASLTNKHESHAEVLPPALYIPWTQVCQRLGRPSPKAALSYIDLVVYNFTTIRGSSANITLENSELLVPTVNNPEERTFYGTMVEINCKVVPILHQIVEAQRAVLMDDVPALKHSLQAMLPSLRDITKSLHKISMKETSNSYVDPVVWTKTVANLAIPWLKEVTGAAGTAHPFFHMMDVFIGRRTYDCKIGREAITVRSTYPVHWQRFLHALGQISVRGYIDQLKSEDGKNLSTLWTTLENEYGGKWGLLGLHRRKVYGFLSVSFRIGRNSTINGLGRATRRAKWMEADRELEKARTERKGTDQTTRNPNSSLRSEVAFYFSDIIQHNTEEQGFWFAAGNHVYDASGFMRNHPGGRTVISLCSGQDATADLAAVEHLADPKIRALLGRYSIGELRRSLFATPGLQQLYNEVASLGQTLAETENIYRTTLSFLHAKMTGLDQPNQLTHQKLQHLYEAKAKLRGEHAATISALLDPILVQLGGSSENHDLSKCQAALAVFRARTPLPVEKHNFPSCEAAMKWFERDFQQLSAMKGLAVTALSSLESLPHSTSTLGLSSGEALVQSLTALANHLLHLGE